MRLNLTDLKNIIRSPYAWPGGYPQYFITADGGALSVQSVRENFREVLAAYFDAGAMGLY